MKIAIDAGHGKYTAGKRVPDDSMREFTFNNAVAQELAKILSQYENVTTFFTYDTTGETDTPLSTRTNRANAADADFLISLHANAAGSVWNDAAVGIETFVYKLSLTSSKRVADAVQAELIAATGLKNRGVKEDNLHMVRESHMPAILVEHGFMTSHTEAALLKSDAFRKKCAAADAAGLVKAFGLKKKATAAPVAAAKNGWKLEGGKWYFYVNNVKKTGWYKDAKGVWYFLNADGSMATEWLRDGDKWYFLREDGAMLTGAITVGGKPYLLRSNGSLVVTNPKGEIIE